MGKRKPKTPTGRRFEFRNGTWDYCLWVQIGGDTKEAARWFSEETKLELQPILDVLGEQGPYGGCVIRNPAYSDHLMWLQEDPCHSTVAHEALHSVHHVLSRVGLGPLSDATEEAYAFLVGWTVRMISSKLW